MPRPLYPRRKSPRYPLSRSLGGPQSRCWRCGEAKNPLPLPGIEPRPSILCLVAILTELLGSSDALSSWLICQHAINSEWRIQNLDLVSSDINVSKWDAMEVKVQATLCMRGGCVLENYCAYLSWPKMLVGDELYWPGGSVIIHDVHLLICQLASWKRWVLTTKSKYSLQNIEYLFKCICLQYKTSRLQSAQQFS
jgi:hypothetical protein